jgi:hypothetical protein
LWWRAPQQMLRTHHSLEASCAILWWTWLVFSFFLVMEQRWNEVTGKNRSTRGKTCSNANLSTTNPTWTDPGSNPGLRGERPATNRLSCGTAYRSIWWRQIQIIKKFSCYFLSRRSIHSPHYPVLKYHWSLPFYCKEISCLFPQAGARRTKSAWWEICSEGTTSWFDPCRTWHRKWMWDSALLSFSS